MEQKIEDQLKNILNSKFNGSWLFNKFKLKHRTPAPWVTIEKNNIIINYYFIDEEINKIQDTIYKFLNDNNEHFMITLVNLTNSKVTERIETTKEMENIISLFSNIKNASDSFSLSNPFIHMIELKPIINESYLEIYSGKEIMFTIKDLKDVDNFNKFQEENEENCMSIIQEVLDYTKNLDEKFYYNKHKKIIKIFNQNHLLSIQKDTKYYRGTFFKNYKQENICISKDLNAIREHFNKIKEDIINEAKYESIFL